MQPVSGAWVLALFLVSFSVSGMCLAIHPVKVPDYVRCPTVCVIFRQKGHFISWPCVLIGGQRDLGDPEDP